MAAKKKYVAYVSTYTMGDHYGIKIYDVDLKKGRFSEKGQVEISNSSYVTISHDEQFLYAITDFGVEEGIPTVYESERSLEYNKMSNAVSYLEKLATLCDEEGIRLYVVTTPIYEATYREAIDNGYLEFLEDAAQVTDFYLFSGLNTYTISGNYYFDGSHFRPYVGLQMEKVVFGTDEERKKAVVEAANINSKVSFGQIVSKDNIDDIIDKLREEVE